MADHPEHSVLAATQPNSRAYLAGVDPRLRVMVAVVFSVLVALADDFNLLIPALVAALVGLGVSGLSWGKVFRRLVPLEAVMAVMFALLPWTTPGTVLWRVGPLEFSREGLLLAAAIAIKGNAIVLGLLALLGNLDGPTLGHTLSHLRVPDKLTHLLMFTVRYLDVLHREYLRLRWAMRVRAFRPRVDRHTYRSFGYLVGMLLVRSFDRSERIMAAMKCRGFRGRFYLLDHFHFHRGDLPFAIGSLVFLSALAWIEWT